MNRVSSAARGVRWFPVFVVGLSVLLASCIQKREEGQQRTVLHKGWQVADDMGGWVAVPDTRPEEQADAKSGLTYYRLATHNVVPAKLHGYWAVSPALFRKLAGLKLKPLKTPESELWKMRPGRRVPKEKEGWIGLPLAYPRFEKRGKGAGLAVLGSGQLIPKEMDGWAAVDRETMAKLAKKQELGKVTIPGKKKKP